MDVLGNISQHFPSSGVRTHSSLCDSAEQASSVSCVLQTGSQRSAGVWPTRRSSQISATDTGAAGGLRGSRWTGGPVVKWCHPGADC